MARSPLAAHDGGHHIHPIRMYVFSAAALTFLMVATIVAWKIEIPGGVWVNNGVAMLIAMTKTFVVVMFFMHVKYSTPLTKLFAMLGFLWATLLGVILVDYFFRAHEPVPSWTGVTETALPRRIGDTDHKGLDPIDQNVQNRLPKLLGN